ncbi:MAG: hypothetical protein ACLP9L_01600 [Thermoguttaceae bacterium]
MAKKQKRSKSESPVVDLDAGEAEYERLLMEGKGDTFVALRCLHSLESEFQGQTDRGAAIIGASLVEAQLPKFIIAHLRNDTDETRRMFGRGQAIESFGSQITFAYAIGLVSEDVYKDLDCIREIRNACAHAIWYVPKKGEGKGQPQGLVTFEQKHIKAMVMGLRCCKVQGLDQWQEEQEWLPQAWRGPRARYVRTCECLHLMLAKYQNPDSPLPLRYVKLALPPITRL